MLGMKALLLITTMGALNKYCEDGYVEPGKLVVNPEFRSWIDMFWRMNDDGNMTSFFEEQHFVESYFKTFIPREMDIVNQTVKEKYYRALSKVNTVVIT